MTTKTKNIIHWSLAGVVGFIFLGSAINKFMGGEEALAMAGSIGLDENSFKILGVIELISVLLFILPRTGILGTLLLTAYMGGAIATHLTHSQSVFGPAVIEAIIWIAAMVRFPEITSRISGSQKNE